MVKIKTILSLVIVFLFVIFYRQVHAQEILTWEDCVKESKNNNPELKSAFEELNQAKADKRITKSSIFPQINSSLSVNTSKSSTTDQTDNYGYSVSGQQLLFDGLKTSNEMKQADETVKSFKYNYDIVSSNIRLNLRVSFAELLRSQEFVKLAKSIAQRREQNLNLVKLRHEAGREHLGSLLTSQADLANANFEVKQAKRQLSLQQNKLIRYLGWDEKKSVIVKGDFIAQKSSDIKPDFKNLAENTPLLKRLAVQKDAFKFNYKASKSNLFPKVFLNTSVGKSASRWPPDSTDWGIGFRVTLPIFEGGLKKAQINKAKAQLEEASWDEISGKDTVIFTLEDTWNNFQDAIETVTVREKFLEAAEERAKIANAQYTTGLISFDDWIIIEDNLVNSKKSYLTALANLLITEANWVQAKGGTLNNE